jgi:exosortase A-associated hydrolase 2
MTQGEALPHAFHLPVDGGHRFCLYHAPASGHVRGTVLCLASWAEELNAARSTLARAARALAADGHAVLQIDPFGCGDSDGRFEQATWAHWVQDARAAMGWLHNEWPDVPRWLWGLRSGALLAADALAGQQQPINLLAWQAPASGQALLQQFLRLAAAGRWLGRGEEATDAPAERLARGDVVDIAGYRLPPALAHGVAQTRWRAPASVQPAKLVWIDAGTENTDTPGPGVQRGIDAWRDAGWAVHWRGVACPPFWQTVEHHDTRPLVDATRALMGADRTP